MQFLTSHKKTEYSEEEILSQLYLALLGEECVFLTKKVSGHEFRILEDSLKQLPFEMTLIMEKIVDIASCVRFIEFCKRKRTLSDSMDAYSLENSSAASKIALDMDAIKKAILESFLNDYSQYLKTVDQMRIEHICSKEGRKSLREVIKFALIWHKRLNFVESILTMLIESKNGMHLLNILYMEWTLNCSKNWETSIMEHALHNGSIVLSNICANWLLDGQLDGGTNWMVRIEQSSKATRNSSSSIGTSFNNSLISIQPELAELFQRGEMERTSGMPKSEPVIPVKFETDEELVPIVIRQNADIIALILEIGKKVRSLKALRFARTYDYKIAERRGIVTESIRPEVWYGPTPGRAPLVQALQLLHQIVSEDLKRELMQTQRLVDHLALVHAYFFMLRGDLFAEMERIILDTFIKPTLYYQTPISLRKRSSQSAKMTEQVMNEALGKCSPPANAADLMALLSSDKASRDRSKTFYESFGLTYDAKGGRKGGGIGQNATMNGQMATMAISQVFTKEVLKIYKRVFRVSSNIQMLRFLMDEISHRFVHDTCPKLNTSNSRPLIVILIQFNLNKVRLFLTRLANYIFEDVLLLECETILGAVQREANFHPNMLNKSIMALGLCREAAPLFESIMDSIRAIRSYVSSVEDFCNAVDTRWHQNRATTLLQKQQQQTPTSMEMDKNGQQYLLSQQRRRLMDSPGRMMINNGVERMKKTRMGSEEGANNKLETQQFVLHECAAQIKKSLSSLHTVLFHYIEEGGTSNNKKQSTYWPKLYALLFD